MLHPQLVVIGMLVGAVLFVGYSNRHMQIELAKANQSLIASERSLPTLMNELRICTTQLEQRKNHISDVENEKKQLNSTLADMEKQFTNMKPQADVIAEKEKEMQELREKLKAATESELKEKRKFTAVQDALDQLAKEEEERNAQKAKAAAQESKTTTDSKKQ